MAQRTRRDVAIQIPPVVVFDLNLDPPGVLPVSGVRLISLSSVTRDSRSKHTIPIPSHGGRPDSDDEQNKQTRSIYNQHILPSSMREASNRPRGTT